MKDTSQQIQVISVILVLFEHAECGTHLVYCLINHTSWDMIFLLLENHMRGSYSIRINFYPFQQYLNYCILLSFIQMG